MKPAEAAVVGRMRLSPAGYGTVWSISACHAGLSQPIQRHVKSRLLTNCAERG